MPMVSYFIQAADGVYFRPMKAEKNEHLADWPVEVVRSARRQKSVSAELKNGVLVVRAPRIG